MRRQSVETTIQQVREQLGKREMRLVALIEKKVYATTIEGNLVSADLSDGKIGEFTDMAEDFGVRKEDANRVADKYVEAVISRDQVEAAQRIRELLGCV